MLVLFFVGRPLYFMELALGQFSSAGCVNVWDMIPALGGVGYGQASAGSLAIIFKPTSWAGSCPGPVLDKY